jgi:hypothetical protein
LVKHRIAYKNYDDESSSTKKINPMVSYSDKYSHHWLYIWSGFADTNGIFVGKGRVFSGFSIVGVLALDRSSYKKMEQGKTAQMRGSHSRNSFLILSQSFL